jgi:hypothetical protein
MARHNQRAQWKRQTKREFFLISVLKSLFKGRAEPQ